MSTAHTFRESLYSTDGTSRTQASPLRGAEVFGSEVTMRHGWQRDKSEQEVTGVSHNRNFEAELRL